MEQLFATGAVWLGLEVICAILAYHLGTSIALVEICMGVAVAGVAN